MEGVSTGIHERMTAVSATVITEHDTLLRVCEHGIRHPVGNIKLRLSNDERRQQHESIGPCGGAQPATCDGCCAGWDGTQ